jgi:beta-glucosidase/6-phospho-beta-glucosidase/beta-galactosidase
MRQIIVILKADTSRLFRSFWVAGFESATHINRAGTRLDMLAATQHDRQVEADYKLITEVGIKAARDGIRWHLIERVGRFDFSSLAPMVEAANRVGIQVIWNICHYGWPNDLDVFSSAFVNRFARFCRVVAHFMKQYSDGVPFYIPINEISFLSWAAGDVSYICPFCFGRGRELKRQLVHAAIAGCEAIWSVTPQARIAHVEPLIHVVPPRDCPELTAAAEAKRASQFEAWDMLAGRAEPSLGGHPRYLDTIGVNYYHSNQWEYPDQRLRWEDNPRDERWLPLRRLLAEVYERYRRPLFVGETSHFGAGRGPWIREVADEVAQAQAAGVPVEGICIYPIVDRPDWDNPDHWHNSGLWDLIPDGQGSLQRVLNPAYAAEFHLACPGDVRATANDTAAHMVRS